MESRFDIESPIFLILFQNDYIVWWITSLATDGTESWRLKKGCQTWNSYVQSWVVSLDCKVFRVLMHIDTHD